MQKNEVSLPMACNDPNHNDLSTLSVPILVPLGSWEQWKETRKEDRKE